MTKAEMQAELDRLRAEVAQLRELVSAIGETLAVERPEYDVMHHPANCEALQYRLSDTAAGIRGVLSAGVDAAISTRCIREMRAQIDERFPYRYAAAATLHRVP